MASVTFDGLKAMTGTVIGVSDWLFVDQAIIEFTGKIEGEEKPALIAEWINQTFI